MDRADMLADIQSKIAANPVMLFMKGTAEHPLCGFSTAAVDVLKRIGAPFEIKNVLDEPEYRYVLSEHSNWPTLPQLFVGGEFVGGCDIIHELFKSGELEQRARAATEQAGG